MWCSTPVLLPLPLLPVWAGLPEGSQTFEAEGSRVGPPPSWGVIWTLREWGKGAKHLPSPGWGGGSAALPSKGIKARKRKRWRMVVAGGAPASIPQPLGQWMGVALTSTWVPCFELLPARDRAAASLGTGGDDVGWYFPYGVPEYTLFPRHVVTNVLLCECMCVCV